MENFQTYQQINYFIKDYRRLAGSKKIRMLYLWLSHASVGILLYRLERIIFLLFGNTWKMIRIDFLPIFLFFYAYSNLEISYLADIGPGITVLHHSLGVVVSSVVTIGNNLTLTIGNIIGRKIGVLKEGEFIIGNNANLGANTVILVPVILGNNIIISAMAMVNKNFESNSMIAGVPAKKIGDIK